MTDLTPTNWRDELDDESRVELEQFLREVADAALPGPDDDGDAVDGLSESDDRA